MVVGGRVVGGCGRGVQGLLAGGAAWTGQYVLSKNALRVQQWTDAREEQHPLISDSTTRLTLVADPRQESSHCADTSSRPQTSARPDWHR